MKLSNYNYFVSVTLTCFVTRVDLNFFLVDNQASLNYWVCLFILLFKLKLLLCLVHWKSTAIEKRVIKILIYFWFAFNSFYTRNNTRKGNKVYKHFARSFEKDTEGYTHQLNKQITTAIFFPSNSKQQKPIFISPIIPSLSELKQNHSIL